MDLNRAPAISGGCRLLANCRLLTIDGGWLIAKRRQLTLRPPLANSRVSVRRSPGWGGGGDGRQVTVSPREGGIARVFQGKLWYPPLMQAKRTRVKRLLR